MPSPHQSSAKASSTGSILLLEEYDALASAIGSAFKKFAPSSTVSRARSLGEAETLAGKINPELIVLDVDPPWSGITPFLERMRTTIPNARVLIIGASIPSEISAERGSFGALQFIGKPFELAAFGAAVQAVLGPWRESGSSQPRGSLQTLNVPDIVLLHCAAGSNVLLELWKKGRSGNIHVAEGRVSHAEAGNLIGAEALRDLLTWNDAELNESKPANAPRRNLRKDWIEIVLETLQKAKPALAPRISPAEQAAPKQARIKSGKEIVVVDDTEMLLIFVEDVLATADPELQITTALTGRDGVEKIGQIMPDLVLLDYSLPDINGDEVCRRLLENEKTARVPILMMSGHVAEMNATAERCENIVATIEKPFLSDALVRLVQKTLAAPPPKRAKRVETPLEPVSTSPAPPQTAEHRRPAVQQPEPRRSTPVAPTIVETHPRTPLPPLVQVGTAEVDVAVLGLFLEVISMQLTPQLQMGAIRARPASAIVSLHFSSAAARGAIPAETGFQLGPAQLDASGRITTLRLLPSGQPFRPSQTQNTFEIGGFALIPDQTRTRVQLTPAGTTPMTIELFAHLELTSVQLSQTFQVAQLILNWPTNIVRVTLNPKAIDKTGASFQPTEVKLDQTGRITELLLKPAT